MKLEKLCERDGDNNQKKEIVFLKLLIRDIVFRSIFKHYLDRAYVPP